MRECEVNRIAEQYIPSPDVGGAVSCVCGAASEAWRLCSALSHC